MNDRVIKALIEPLNTEDRLLFTRAYRDHHASLVTFVRRRVSTDAEAADVVQEAYLRALRYRDRQDLDTLKSLLFQIAINLLAERVRVARTHRVADHVPLEDALSVVATDPSQERRVAGEQDLIRLLAVIDKLPRKRREVFLLRRYEGLSYEQIAERLGIRAMAVERHVTRAVAFCRKKLSGESGRDRF